MVDASCMVMPLVIATWASTVAPRCSTDFDRDGVIGTVDQTLLPDKWDHDITLVVPPPAWLTSTAWGRQGSRFETSDKLDARLTCARPNE